MKHQVSASAKCPYYKCEERHEIFCRGPKEQTSVHLAFAIPAEKKVHMKNHCKSLTGCSACVVYQILEKADVKG